MRAGIQLGRLDASLFDLIVRLNLAVPYLFWRKTSLLTSKMLPVVGNNSPCSERPGTGSFPSPAAHSHSKPAVSSRPGSSGTKINPFGFNRLSFFSFQDASFVIF